MLILNSNQQKANQQNCGRCGSAGKESACNAETWVRSLGWEDPLEKGKATQSIFWPGEFHELYSPWGRKESDTTERLSLHFKDEKAPVSRISLHYKVKRT